MPNTPLLEGGGGPPTPYNPKPYPFFQTLPRACLQISLAAVKVLILACYRGTPFSGKSSGKEHGT